MIASILAALDHTEKARGVLAVATTLAERFEARLHLFRAIAVAQSFPPAASTASHPDRLPAFLRMEALNDLDTLARGNMRALAHPPIVMVGSPAHAILEAAEQVDADLIVIGSHRLHGLDHLFGTTSGSVATRAPCSVYVVHERTAMRP